MSHSGHRSAVLDLRNEKGPFFRGVAKGWGPCRREEYLAYTLRVRSLSLFKTQETRDSSARSVPRNDNAIYFSESYLDADNH
jgi:hypothetical protein